MKRTARETIETVYVEGKGDFNDAESRPDCFVLVLYDKTKDDKDFNHLWDSAWSPERKMGLLYGMQKDEICSSEDLSYWMKALRFDERCSEEYAKWWVGHDEKLTPPQAYELLLEDSKKIRFPWKGYIEHVRERIKEKR